MLARWDRLKPEERRVVGDMMNLLLKERESVKAGGDERAEVKSEE